MSSARADQGSEATKEATEHNEVTFHYIKSNLFRVVHCDAVIGGPSPNGQFVHMAITSERLPLPQQVTHRLENQQLKEQISSVARHGIVREIELDLVMPLEVAASVAVWLAQQVKTAQGNEPK